MTARFYNDTHLSQKTQRSMEMSLRAKGEAI